MATRSVVGYKNSDGTVNASYVHFDGYLDGVGVALQLNHNNDAKAKKLGYAKGIRSIELDQPVSYYNDMENETYESEDQFHDEVVKDTSIEYGYLYDPSRGWLFSSSKYGTNEFIELEDQLMYDELLPGSGDAPDMSMMENVSISNLKPLKEDLLNRIKQIQDFEKTEDDLYYNGHFVQKYVEDGETTYVVFKDRGLDVDPDPTPDFESTNPNSVKAFLLSKTEKMDEVEVGVVDKIQDEEEMGLEEAFDDLVKKVDKAKGYTKKEAEKVAGAIAAKKMKGAGKGPTAKQKARVKEAEITDGEKKKLKKISKQLKKSVKAHDKQAKIIDKALKEDKKEIYDSMRGLTLNEYFKRFIK